MQEQRSTQVCTIEGCADPVLARGWCRRHYQRWYNWGDPYKTKYIRKGQPRSTCSVEGCERLSAVRTYCQPHYSRWRRWRDPLGGGPNKGPRGDGYVNSEGYRRLYLKNHPNANTRGHVSEHTAVMSEHLHRPLRKGETVHHRNGIKDDNRLENLELMVKIHPPGQRVTDLVAFAQYVLATYGDEAQQRLNFTEDVRNA